MILEMISNREKIENLITKVVFCLEGFDIHFTSFMFFKKMAIYGLLGRIDVD